MLARDTHELGHARHRAVLVHHLADHAGGEEAGQRREVDGRLGVARAHEHARPRCAISGKTWPGIWKSCGFAPGSVDRAHRGGAVERARAGRRPVPVVDRDRERRARGPSLVSSHHLRDPELVEAPGRHRQAHDPAAVGDHEVHRLGGRLLGGDDEVAFVLAVGVVDDDDDLAVADRPRAPRRSSRTSTGPRRPRAAARSSSVTPPSGAPRTRAITSTSRFTGSPATCGAQGRHGQRVRDQRDRERPVVVQRGDREADAVDRDRALLDQVAAQSLRHADPQP